jgi:hypothetical protein
MILKVTLVLSVQSCSTGKQVLGVEVIGVEEVVAIGSATWQC